MYIIKRFISLILMFFITSGCILIVISVFNTETVPILLYHHISEDGVGDSTIAVKTFISHMDAICEAGYQTITFQQLREYVMNGTELPEKPIMITFAVHRAK